MSDYTATGLRGEVVLNLSIASGAFTLSYVQAYGNFDPHANGPAAGRFRVANGATTYATGTRVTFDVSENTSVPECADGRWVASNLQSY